MKIEVNSTSQVVNIDFNPQLGSAYALPKKDEGMALTKTNEMAIVNIDVFGGLDKLFSLNVTVKPDETIDNTEVSSGLECSGRKKPLQVNILLNGSCCSPPPSVEYSTI